MKHATDAGWWSKTPTVDIYTVTKNLVDDLLACNTSNRKVRAGHVERLKDAILAGDYKLIASGVGLSKTGILLDGQHRLLALKECGYPAVQLILAQGLEDDSQLVVDRHAKRSMADAISLYLNQSVTSNIVAIINNLNEVNAAKGKNVQFMSANKHLGDVAISEYFAQYGDLLHDVTLAYKGRASIGSAIFVYAVHDRVSALEFAKQVNTGLDLSLDSPAYRLRQTADRLKTANGASGRLALFKAAVSAVVAHSRGRSMGQLKGSDSWANAPWKWELDAP